MRGTLFAALLAVLAASSVVRFELASSSAQLCTVPQWINTTSTSGYVREYAVAGPCNEGPECVNAGGRSVYVTKYDNAVAYLNENSRTGGYRLSLPWFGNINLTALGTSTRTDFSVHSIYCISGSDFCPALEPVPLTTDVSGTKVPTCQCGALSSSDLPGVSYVRAVRSSKLYCERDFCFNLERTTLADGTKLCNCLSHAIEPTLVEFGGDTYCHYPHQRATDGRPLYQENLSLWCRLGSTIGATQEKPGSLDYPSHRRQTYYGMQS